MFTGIIEEKGILRKVLSGGISGSVEIRARAVLEGTKVGDSIAVNGVCLTVTSLRPDSFTADVMPETLRRTNLGSLPLGAEVNLERAMAAGGRFGGHIVSGHIDGTGTVRSLKPEGNAVWVSIDAPSEILHLIVEKGSICIDGISLTVAYVDETCFKVSIIPHTGEETTLLSRKAGDIVNLENDIVAKYIEKLIQPYGGAGTGGSGHVPAGDQYTGSSRTSAGSGLTLEFLAEHGF
jgi:riboflavin synthase